MPPQRGNLIPVYRELLADGDTPVSAYAALGGGRALVPARVGGRRRDVGRVLVRRRRRRARSCAWSGGHCERRPGTTSTAAGRRATASGRPPDPTAALAEVLGELRPVDVPGLPRFWGGAVGWIALRLRARVRGSAGARAPGELDLPPLCMVVTDTLLIFDNLRQTLKVVATPYVARPERRRARVRRARARASTRSSTTLRAPRRPLPRARAAARRRARRARRRRRRRSRSDDFLAAVDRVKEYILAGDVFQVVLSQRFSEPRGRRAIRSTSIARCA